MGDQSCPQAPPRLLETAAFARRLSDPALPRTPSLAEQEALAGLGLTATQALSAENLPILRTVSKGGPKGGEAPPADAIPWPPADLKLPPCTPLLPPHRCSATMVRCMAPAGLTPLAGRRPPALAAACCLHAAGRTASARHRC